MITLNRGTMEDFCAGDFGYRALPFQKEIVFTMGLHLTSVLVGPLISPEGFYSTFDINYAFLN
jgi:hypothetical protein